MTPAFKIIEVEISHADNELQSMSEICREQKRMV